MELERIVAAKERGVLQAHQLKSETEYTDVKLKIVALEAAKVPTIEYILCCASLQLRLP
jgi:hypothetical protein